MTHVAQHLLDEREMLACIERLFQLRKALGLTWLHIEYERGALVRHTICDGVKNDRTPLAQSHKVHMECTEEKR